MKKSWLITLFSLSAFAAAANGERAGVRCNLSATDARNAIVGEAAAAPYIVKLGIADALHNRAATMRHPLAGVYGYHAAHNAGESRATWTEAARAWRESLTRHVANGADHFGNADDVRKGTFLGMKLVAVLGLNADGTPSKHTTYFFKA